MAKLKIAIGNLAYYVFIGLLLFTPAYAMYKCGNDLFLCDTSNISKWINLIFFSLSVIEAVIIYPVFIYIMYCECGDFLKKLKRVIQCLKN